MHKPISKLLVVVAMLIAFVGQALAYSTMACEMTGDMHQDHMSMTSSTMSEHGDMDHSNMDHANMNHDNMTTSEDCCGIDCMCPANACTSLSFLTETSVFSNTLIASETVPLHGSLQLNSLPSSLYRPPIFA